METKKGLNYEDFLAAEKTMPKYKILEFEIGDHILNVKVLKKLGLEEKSKIAQDAVGIIEGNKNLGEEYALTLAILKTMTDIEFPTDEEKLARMMIKMLDYNMVRPIFETIGTEALNEIAIFLEEFSEALPDLLKELVPNGSQT